MSRWISASLMVLLCGCSSVTYVPDGATVLEARTWGPTRARICRERAIPEHCVTTGWRIPTEEEQYRSEDEF